MPFQRKRIMSVDVGLSTGVVIAESRARGECVILDSGTYEVNEEKPFDALQARFLVVEMPTSDQHMSGSKDLAAARSGWLSWAETFSKEHKMELVFVSASQWKTSRAVMRLKVKSDWPVRLRTQHERDAYGIALYFASKK